MGSSATRSLELLSLLQARPRWTAPELADRLGITERTVRRDMARLRDLGYPVIAEPGRAGGYRLGAGGALPPLLLSDDESVAVAIGLRVAATGGAAGHEEAAVAALAKLEQMLPARLRDRVQALSTATVVVRPGEGPATRPEVLLTLAQGCRHRERVRFRYLDGSGNASERRVEPYQLVNAERRWYLVARDLDRADWRTFRLDRMGVPELTGHRFVRAEEPDAAAMVERGMAVASYTWQATVLVRAPRAQVEEEVPRTVGVLDDEPPRGDDPGGTVMRIGANQLDWLARYLAGLPFEVEVRDPPELRAALRALARRLQQAHRG
jgi:predicted DNA-binding transcriptional regulator YafY